MTPQDVISLFRTTVFDTVVPYLWSDVEAMEYLNDAQRQLCRLTFGLNDGSRDDVTLYQAPAGCQWIDLHPSIMKVKTVQRLSDYKFIGLLNIEDLQEGRAQAGHDYGDVASLRLDDRTGELMYLVLGMSEGRARLLHIPEQDERVRLTVERLPLVDVSPENVGLASLEVRLEHHRHLVWWMAHLAYLKQDGESFDKTKSEEFEAKFRNYCEASRVEKERREHKTRVVGYGGY